MKPNGMIENPRTDARLVLRDYRDGRDGVVAIAPEMLYATHLLLTAVFEEVLNDPGLDQNAKTIGTALDVLWNFEEPHVLAAFAESSEASQGLYAMFKLLPEDTQKMARFLVVRALTFGWH